MLLNFAFLFALIWLFDRKRDDLDAFTIATAVIVPGIIVFLFRLTRMFFEWGLWGPLAHFFLEALQFPFFGEGGSGVLPGEFSLFPSPTHMYVCFYLA